MPGSEVIEGGEHDPEEQHLVVVGAHLLEAAGPGRKSDERGAEQRDDPEQGLGYRCLRGRREKQSDAYAEGDRAAGEAGRCGTSLCVVKYLA